jgi:diaminopimelate epimerase
MTLQFTKMHALGNDFMVIDATQQPVSLTKADIVALACRHTGIGFDQCLLIEPSPQDDIDFFYRIYNADGSEVGQCGNGARCLARFIQHYQLSSKHRITIATTTTQMCLQINSDNTVTIELKQPMWQDKLHCLTIENQPYRFHQIDIGNPHAVLLSTDIQQAPVNTIGKQLSTHPFFPHQCNIGFMQVLSSTHIQCRVYERGAGETQACGSGAIAAAAIGRLFHDLSDTVTVSLPGGDLLVHWPSHNGPIFLTGTATFVYEGRLF